MNINLQHVITYAKLECDVTPKW